MTALYELLPVASNMVPKVDPLKYQRIARPADNSATVLSVKLRYKPLNSDKSLLLTRAVTDNSKIFAATSDDFRFASTVAGFGMLLCQSDHNSQLSCPQLVAMARESRGTDQKGYRAEFFRLLEMSEVFQDK